MPSRLRSPYNSTDIVPSEVTPCATAESSKLKFLWIPPFAEVTASKSSSFFYKLP